MNKDVYKIRLFQIGVIQIPITIQHAANTIQHVYAYNNNENSFERTIQKGKGAYVSEISGGPKFTLEALRNWTPPSGKNCTRSGYFTTRNRVLISTL